MKYILGVDSGGTFTDCVLVDADGQVTYDKALSTPAQPAEGVLAAVANAARGRGLDLEDLFRETAVFGHGTTVGLNKLFTRSGARLGLITTKGHEDAILIGRVYQKVAGLTESEISHAARLDKAEPLVPRRLIHGVTERVDYSGHALVPLNEAETRAAIEDLVHAGVEALAVCFLWSFMNPAHERRVKEMIEEIAPGLFVTLSSDIAPLLGEYERVATTVINSYLGPTVNQYIQTLDGTLRSRGLARPLLIMQSNGGVIPAEEAGPKAINLLSSGPVGGVIASRALGQLLDQPNIIATDVGGTSFDVGLVVGGDTTLAKAPVFQKYQVLVPMVDVVSIGAGGGSIAWLEPETGVLRVGPKSAGARPGPVCYGFGGTEPTVTDADVLLGRINPAYFFGGRMQIDLEGARRAVEERLARPLGLDPVEVASGIVDIVDAHMADLVRKVTIEKGYDPREFSLFAYGGGGPAHVGAYARDVGVRMAIISPYAPVFSAFGIATSDMVRFYSKAEPMVLPADAGRIETIYRDLETRAMDDLRRAGFDGDEVLLLRHVEMKYKHQVNEVRVAVPGGAISAGTVDDLVERFESAYEQIYGRGTAYRQAGAEFGTFSVTAVGRIRKAELQRFSANGTNTARALKGERPVYFDRAFMPTPIYDGERLGPGMRLSGPAIVESPATTVVAHPGQMLTVDEYLNLVLTFGEES